MASNRNQCRVFALEAELISFFASESESNTPWEKASSAQQCTQQNMLGWVGRLLWKEPSSSSPFPIIKSDNIFALLGTYHYLLKLNFFAKWVHLSPLKTFTFAISLLHVLSYGKTQQAHLSEYFPLKLMSSFTSHHKGYFNGDSSSQSSKWTTRNNVSSMLV